jgi:hypothetical protein
LVPANAIVNPGNQHVWPEQNDNPDVRNLFEYSVLSNFDNASSEAGARRRIFPSALNQEPQSAFVDATTNLP